MNSINISTNKSSDEKLKYIVDVLREKTKKGVVKKLLAQKYEDEKYLSKLEIKDKGKLNMFVEYDEEIYSFLKQRLGVKKNSPLVRKVINDKYEELKLRERESKKWKY